MIRWILNIILFPVKVVFWIFYFLFFKHNDF